MMNYLLERGLYAAMAAVLIVPEPATFLVFLGLFVSLTALLGQFAWAIIRDPDSGADNESPEALVQT